MHIVAVPLLGIIFNIILRCIEANLALDFKVTRIPASHKAANCNVANTTYAHGETFKLDCKTQCVCENGRHACSTLCPKEQLPAPEDTISCRSPRLVEVPGHCCKMWLCENPTADVYATCHNSSTSPWTPCSRKCGLGISTRFTTTTAGCNQLSNLRLCENRKCEILQNNAHKQPLSIWNNVGLKKKKEARQKYLMKTKQLKNILKRQKQQQQRKQKHQNKNKHMQQECPEHEHRIRKGHECRSIQRLGPARIRLGQCVSKKLYRPKICGRCHQNTKCCVPSVSTTIQVELLCPLNAIDPISYVQQQLTIGQQQQQQQQQGQPFYPTTETSASTSTIMSSSLTSLWDTHSLDAIDQEYLQSHQIQIENKFIAVEWILKCECSINDNCQRIVNTTITDNKIGNGNVSNRIGNSNYRKHQDHGDKENVDNKNMQNIKYFKHNFHNNKNKKNIMYYKNHKQQQTGTKTTIYNDKMTENNAKDSKHDYQEESDEHEDEFTDTNMDNDSAININSNSYNSYDYMNGIIRLKGISDSERNINGHNHKKQTKDYDGIYKNKNNYNYNNYNNKDGINERGIEYEIDDGGELQTEEQQEEWSTSLSSSSLLMHGVAGSTSTSTSTSSSDEMQPDIIPYPPPPFSANKHTNNSNKSSNNNSNNKNIQANGLKGKSKLQQNKLHQQQQIEQEQHYERWLLKQFNNPYHEQNKKSQPT